MLEIKNYETSKMHFNLPPFRPGQRNHRAHVNAILVTLKRIRFCTPACHIARSILEPILRVVFCCYRCWNVMPLMTNRSRTVKAAPVWRTLTCIRSNTNSITTLLLAYRRSAITPFPLTWTGTSIGICTVS